jgi:hypothetical protein
MTGEQGSGGGAGGADGAAGGAEGKGGWKRPTDSPVITSPFGPRNVPGGSKNHKGIDLRARMGDPIYAAKDGTVSAAGGSYSGVTINHEGGVASRYLHLSKINVQAGQQVKEGQIIGLSGGMGPKGPNQYPAHLHFEILKGGQPTDPEPFMKSAGIALNRKGEKGNEGMAPQSDADAVPKTGKEQSAGQLTDQEAKAGNTDAKAAESASGSGSTAGIGQSQGEDIAKQSADMAKTEISSTLKTAYGDGSSQTAPTGGGASGGASMPTGGSSSSASAGGSTSGNVSTDNGGMPQVTTNTPTQTGQIGPDIATNASLEQLKMITSLLSSIRDDMSGYFGDGSKKSTPEGNPLASSKANEAKQEAGIAPSQESINTAVQTAFAPNSPVLDSIRSTFAEMMSNNSTTPVQNLPKPQTIDRSTVRSPIDTSKRSGVSFQG